ncbi:MAG TPA: helix-hairpin-helix domain-containing protein [Chitinophagaceae bacterium]|nr:helix-hairpin-helix domain-containing protein [Chitinophagaceae bacterium]
MSKAIWKDYFSFSKKERIAVIILLFIIGVFIILPYFFSPQFKKPVVDQQFQKQLLALQNTKQYIDTISDSIDVYNKPVPLTTQKNKSQLFYFDPNTLDADGFKKLGLRDKTIQTIINYRNKGGQFKQPEDIRKIYGLHKEEADLLIPYIHIKSPSQQNLQSEKALTENNQQTKTISNPKKIDINTATADEWKSLPGIGDVLSKRIVKFRNAIHGFKSVEDIRKTYGLSDSAYQLILPYLTTSDTTIPKN